jgi:drug/metabolite transporter (DMT)-like permease
MNSKALACMAFVFNALLFGTYYAISKEALGRIDPILFTFFEMITLVPVAVGILIWTRRQITRTLLKRGFLLGSCLCLALFTIAIGLKYTTATCTAFFPSLNGFLAAFLAWMVLRQPVAKTTWIAGALSIIGSVLLIVNASLGGLRGSLIALLGGLFFTGYVFLSENVQKDELDPWALLGVELLTMALWATLIMLLFGDWSSFHPQLPKDMWVILYVAGACTFLPTLLTVLMQKHVSPITISFIYILEPIFGAIAAFFYLHEVLPPGGYLGGGFVVLGAIIHTGGSTIVSPSPGQIQTRRPAFLSVQAMFTRIVGTMMVPVKALLDQHWSRGGSVLRLTPFQQTHAPLLLMGVVFSHANICHRSDASPTPGHGHTQKR